MSSSLRTLMSLAGIPIKDRGTNVGREYLNICCPFCHETKFHCTIHEEEAFFKCWVCSEKGQWPKLAYALKDDYPSVDWFGLARSRYVPVYIDQAKQESLAPDLQSLTRPFDSYTIGEISDRDRAAWGYLTNVRQMAAGRIQEIAVGVGVGKLKGYVTFVSGTNLVARKFRGFGPRWWKSTTSPFVFGLEDAKRRAQDWTVVTEGVFDVLALPPGCAVAVLGTGISDRYVSIIVENLPETNTVIMGLDKGVAEKTRMKLALPLMDLGYNVVDWNWNDKAFDATEEYRGVDDLDEVRLAYGDEWILEHTLKLAGILDADLELL